MAEKSTQKKNRNGYILQKLTEAVGIISYGTVSIKIHDSKITQVEITEKKRFDDIWRVEEGGGI